MYARFRAGSFFVAGLFLASVAVIEMHHYYPLAIAEAAGPDTCKQGFVWREAVAGDHVCVLPEVREKARKDNAEASARRNPNGGDYGVDTCKQGFVWREVIPSDHVCVIPPTRQEVAID